MQNPESLRARAAETRSEAELRRLWSDWRTVILQRLVSGAGMAAAPRPPQPEVLCR